MISRDGTITPEWHSGIHMTAAIKIRLVGPGDTALFDRVAADVFDEPVHPARLAAYLAEPGHLMMVALHDREIVGQVAAVMHRHPDKPTELYVDEVGVTPALQRRGIARGMLEAMIAHGKALGCEEAWVGTMPDNVAAKALYAACGAEPQTFVMYEMDL